MKRSASSRAFGAVLLGAIVIGALAVSFLPGRSDGLNGSATSAEPNGRLVSFLLLRRLGFEPGLWRDAPADLPRGGAALWVTVAPAEGSSYGPEEGAGEAEPTEQARRARGLLDRRHYARFLREGGTLVLPLRRVADLDSERSGANFDFAREVLGLEDLVSLEVEEDEAAGVQTALLPDGELLSLRARHPRRLAPLARGAEAEALAIDAERFDETGEEWPLALRVPYGEGAVVLLADDLYFANERIPEADNALYLVRLAESLRPGGPLSFDEYGLGGWAPDTWMTMAVGPRLVGATAHLMLLALLVLWMLAWRREFPRDREPYSQLAPLARARAQAGLYLRAGRYELIAEGLCAGVRRRLDDRRGRSPAEPVQELAKDVKTAEDLERLGRELRRLEHPERLPSSP